MFPGNPNRPDDSEFSVKPRESTPPKARPIVRIYFIGTRTLRDGKPPIVTIAGRAIQLPPIGEYLDVTDITANELMHRLAWAEPNNPTPIPGITTSKDIADAVKAMYAAGREDLDVRQMVAQHSVTSLPESALIAELVRRGTDVSALALRIAADEKQGIVRPTAPLTAPPQAVLDPSLAAGLRPPTLGGHNDVPDDIDMALAAQQAAAAAAKTEAANESSVPSPAPSDSSLTPAQLRKQRQEAAKAEDGKK